MRRHHRGTEDHQRDFRNPERITVLIITDFGAGSARLLLDERDLVWSIGRPTETIKISLFIALVVIVDIDRAYKK